MAENRDTNEINDFAVVKFREVLGEPDGVRSLDCTWKWVTKVFEGSMGCCYTLLSTLCGIPAAIFWGLGFACISFQAIWCGSPCFKAFAIVWQGFYKVYSATLRGILDPCFESIGLALSHISIQHKS